jgi:hypothetical protein
MNKSANKKKKDQKDSFQSLNAFTWEQRKSNLKMILLILLHFVILCSSLQHYYLNTRTKNLQNNELQVLFQNTNNYNGIPNSDRTIIQNHLSSLVKTMLITQSTFIFGSKLSIAEYIPEITDKVYMDIKIANYTEESIGKNKAAVGSGRIVVGLFGKEAPQSVKLFLDTIRSDGKTAPTFFNSQISRISMDEGLVEIEKMRSLNPITIAGDEKYEYAGNVLDYKPILENSKVSHAK